MLFGVCCRLSAVRLLSAGRQVPQVGLEQGIVIGLTWPKTPAVVSSQFRKMSDGGEHPAVTNFRQYLRIKTVQPTPDYDGAFVFLKQMADDLKLPCRQIEVCTDPQRSVFLMTWEGSDPSLPSLLLNSHIDVVPVIREFWKVDPFEAYKDENGDIFARGTQDMKCVGIQYLEAVRQMRQEGTHLPRTMHICFVPDEEIGGHLGMERFVHTEEFKKLNIGFALDEGLANPTSAFTVFYGERSPWWVHVHCPGNTGHGSRFIPNNAAEKLRKVINSFLDFRDKEENRLKSDSKLQLGDVTTVNLTKLEGGVQQNVVPPELSVVFDIRVAPSVDLIEFEKELNLWCQDAGHDVRIEFVQKYVGKNITAATDENPWWKAFRVASEQLGITLEKQIFPAATDSRYLRAAGYPAIGFSPINKTEILLHDHNEYLNEDVFLRGIPIYKALLAALAAVPNFDPKIIPVATA